MTPNRLSREKSPYLLQHAHNPVDWYAWGEEAFQKARSENKPIFLSIGYSTCHWCHVMERESFESDEVAEVLNRSFVPIKVDREERPDVDRIYMTFVQATTGSGGWPMSVWLTPDLKPFFGGTYFPPDSRYGRPGFRSILEQLALAWQTDRAKIVESGDHVLQEIEKHVRASGPAYAVDPAVLDSAFYQFRRSFDSKLGGFGGAPKFPRAVSFNFLLRYHKRSRNDEALEMTLVTLREMAKGGMNDQIGGGFHRYSVDARWFVPHFEKMLYDQAQLAISYVEAYQITGEPEFADTARRVLDYVLRDMTDPAGGFYSAEDADSVIDPANPKEKGEGAFYIWSDQEMRAVLESPVVDWFSFRYGVESGGNVNEDPHQEFTGKNILYQRRSIEETAKRFGVSSDAVGEALEQASQKLLQARSTRIRPHLDDKILTAWNGLMISAFAKGALALKEPRYLAAASGAAAFVQSELYRDGVLLRRYRDGEAAIHGFLDDYSYFGLGLVDLYEASFDRRWLDLAAELARKMISLFEDAVGGGFFSSPEGDTSLVMRIKEDYDGAEPSGNSMAILLLLRLSAMLGDAQFREVADKALRAFASRIGSQPTGMPQMLVAFLLSLTPPKQIVLAGEAIEPLRDVLAARFLPEHALLRSGHTATEYPEVNGKAAAYVCENFACKLPVTEASELQALLQ